MAFYRLVSQAWYLWRKKSIIWSLRFSTGFSLMLIILQLLLSTSHCMGASSTPLSLRALLQSVSASRLDHQQTECPQLWFGYNSLWICCGTVYKVSLPNKPSAQSTFSTFGDFVSLESRNLYPVIFDTEACDTSHTEHCSHPCWHWPFFTNWSQNLTWGVILFRFLIAST